MFCSRAGAKETVTHLNSIVSEFFFKSEKRCQNGVRTYEEMDAFPDQPPFSTYRHDDTTIRTSAETAVSHSSSVVEAEAFNRLQSKDRAVDRVSDSQLFNFPPTFVNLVPNRRVGVWLGDYVIFYPVSRGIDSLGSEIQVPRGML